MSESEDSQVRLFVLGATHHRVPIDVREKLALSAESAEELRLKCSATAGVNELVILNTCNRVEFYGVASGEASVEAVREAFCARQHFDAAEFRRFCLDLRGEHAIQHLLEVASGLDSQIVGENEIFGQVKEAYSAAQARGNTGSVLNRIFQKAFQAAKQVRTETAISHGQVSVANVAVELALGVFGELASTRTLLVGAGEIGEKTAKAFMSRGAKSLTVCSRSLSRAMELASTLGAAALPFEQREPFLEEFDIVVCATSAPHTVISAKAVEAAMRRRKARPLLFVDLALPRDVEAGAADVENVYLYNLDDLAKVADENRKKREANVTQARSLLAEKSSRLWKNVCGRSSGLSLPSA